MNLEGAVALITGGAQGIGKACAKRLARAGAKVVICDLSVEATNKVVAEIKANGGEALGIFGDVTKEDDQARFVKETIDTFGRINILIPSAGIVRDATIITTDKESGKVTKKMSLEQWKSVIDVNMTGTFLSIRETVEAMVNCGWKGIIFTISSISKEGEVGQINYSSTKNAVASMPKILIGEFLLRRIKNIRVVGIAPGYVGTELLDSINQDVLTSTLQDVHLGRLIDPGEVAALIVHCIENEAINGTTIEITGGLCYKRARAR